LGYWRDEIKFCWPTNEKKDLDLGGGGNEIESISQDSIYKERITKWFDSKPGF